MMLVGDGAYYLVSILPSIVLQDNRTFFKYLCPIPVGMKVLSRFSVLKQEIKKDDCTECGLCEEYCLIDIKLLDYARQNQRVLSTECILCNTYVNIFSIEAIQTTRRLDA